ncbi:hypothetical protein [Alkaliphilus serpentinus]|uniref:Type 4 fimbrial biogenesis protein PilX N-terminal domain-containing protein n=1 Tax=Alkaliphilus serpentinus TaxID=1482731 RepID=A0A833HMI4_9FIRM|nr:hypothetical protein [Alkaliphilus serpentinus]KAB3527589.1 hypothetical protein F8153_11430 [Alkaliphilus serpentinus]
MLKIYKVIKSKNGASLPLVLIVFMVITILIASVIYINNTNIKQVKLQEDSMRAYYLATSGAELAYGALMMDNAHLLDDFINDPTHQMEELNKPFGNGTIDVSVSSFTKDGEQWIRILSIGRLGVSGVTHSTKMEFNINNPTAIYRSK